MKVFLLCNNNISLMNDLEIIVKEKMSMLEGTVHSYEHVEKVLQIATFLAEKEESDPEIIQVASILHDVGRAIGEPHGETGA